MPLLEREQPLSCLETTLAETQAGEGRIVLVSGEAGIGKTSLVEAFTRPHRKETPILWGVCDSLYTPQPLGPLLDMAAQLKGVLPELQRPETNRAAIFSAVLSELQLRTAIIVFEDIHWADQATLDLLRYLGRRITLTRSLIVLTYRDDELGPHHPLYTLLGDLSSSSATRRVPLSPLSENAVRILVGDQAINVDALYHQTGGNPFFVTEVLANNASTIPPSVRDAVLARAARLSPSGHKVLEAAAVIVPRIEPWLLDEVCGEQGYAVEECIRGGMLRAQGIFLAFRHELERQTILETLSPKRRQDLNQLILNALRGSPYTRGDMARLSHHAEGAGDRTAVLAFAPAAAKRAAAADAHRESAALYALALQYADDLSRREHIELLRLYAQACYSIDNRVFGLEKLRTALALCRELGDNLLTGAVLAQIAHMQIGLGKDNDAFKNSKEGIDLLENLPPSQELAFAYRVQAGLDMAHHNLSDAIAWANKSIAIASQYDDKSELYAAQAIRGSTLMLLDYEQGCLELEQCQKEAHDAGRKTTAVLAFANLGSVSCELHHFRRAERYLNEGLAYAARYDLDRLRYYMLAWLASTQLNLGLWNEAADNAETVLRDAQWSVTSRLTALVTLGRLRARRGDPQANPLLDEALQISSDMAGIERVAQVRGARAETAWLAGDMEGAAAEAQAVFDLALNKKHPWYAAELAFWLFRAGKETPFHPWMASPFTLHIAGDWSTAAVEWEKLGCPYEQAFALADGDPPAQIAALEIFERLGAWPAAEKLRLKLRASGSRNLPHKPRSATRENPFGLTQRQVEILRLIMEGLTNLEIASRLHISPKTTDHHVSAILAKLDVHSRETAASLARQHPFFKEK